jgi:hypothetical protein
MTEFNPAKSREELRTAAVTSKSPRLAFPDQCALFIAARDRMAPHPILAQAFGVTPGTVSAIANCLNPARRIHKYASVAKEYDRLGDEPFAQRYWREEHAARILRLKYDAPEPGDNRRSFAPNPLADKFSFARFNAFAVPKPLGGTEFFRVDWVKAEMREGWYFRSCADNGEVPPDAPLGLIGLYCGRDAIDENARYLEPFRTSAEAYDGAFTIMGESSPRPKPGRPKK